MLYLYQMKAPDLEVGASVILIIGMITCSLLYDKNPLP